VRGKRENHERTYGSRTPRCTRGGRAVRKRSGSRKARATQTRTVGPGPERASAEPRKARSGRRPDAPAGCRTAYGAPLQSGESTSPVPRRLPSAVPIRRILPTGNRRYCLPQKVRPSSALNFRVYTRRSLSFFPVFFSSSVVFHAYRCV
jgi:hypothetical protein